MRYTIAIAGLTVSLAGCETYELPPRLRGVGTEDCPTCEELVLSETRLPPGSVELGARFAFEDDLGALAKIQAFVTTPSGQVLEETVDEDDSRESRPGFTCVYVSEISADVGSQSCEVSSSRANANNSVDVGRRLAGYQQGNLSVGLGLDATEVGEWTVEFVATRSDGTTSNRLSNTFEVVEDVGDDSDGDRVDPDTDTDTQ